MARANKNRKRGRKRTASVSSASPRSYSEMSKAVRIPEAVAQAEAPAAPAAPKGSNGPSLAATSELRGSETVDWRTEYAQVLQDLRYLLIVTAALFILMLVLGYTI